MHTVDLVEEQPFLLERRLLGETEALRLHQHHSRQLQIDFPSPLHPTHYALRSRGWVGQLSAGPLLIRLHAKISLRNLFGMIEAAYQLEGLHLFSGRVEAGSVEGIFSHLATLLAKGVQARLHQGLYREYRECEEDLPYVRGRIRFGSVAGPRTLRCAYQEHSAAGMDNLILAWTLHAIRGFRFGQEEVQRRVRQVYRLMAAVVPPSPVQAAACLNRPYHRLNQDYQPLHALCCFFLEHGGPAMSTGDHGFLPFAVHLPTLFEGFATHWLKARLPAGLHLEVQHRAGVEGSTAVAFQIDLVLRGEGGKVLAVLDTKYKDTPEPSSEDVQQIVAYAVRMGTQKAFLIYPSTATPARRLKVGMVQVDILSFELNRELNQSGSAVLAGLLAELKIT